jgi:hypothetical protein
MSLSQFMKFSEFYYIHVCLKMTNLLDIIHCLFLIKTHNVSETGVCLHRQVKYIYSVGPSRQS